MANGCVCGGGGGGVRNILVGWGVSDRSERLLIKIQKCVCVCVGGGGGQQLDVMWGGV